MTKQVKMQKFDIVKIIGENQVTRLEAVLARMVELEASQDPYMLQVIDLVIFLLSHVVTLNILPLFITTSLQQRLLSFSAINKIYLILASQLLCCKGYCHFGTRHHLICRC